RPRGTYLPGTIGAKRRLPPARILRNVGLNSCAGGHERIRCFHHGMSWWRSINAYCRLLFARIRKHTSQTRTPSTQTRRTPWKREQTSAETSDEPTTTSRAFARGDSKGLANLYTEDGMLLPAGTDFISGKEKIAGFWQAVMDMGIKRAKLEIIETEQHGDTAIEMSRYRLSGADGELMDEGKYIVVWK